MRKKFSYSHSGSPSSLSVNLSPVLDIGLPDFKPLGHSHPLLARHLANIIDPHSLGASYVTLADPRSPFKNSLTKTSVCLSSELCRWLSFFIRNPSYNNGHIRNRKIIIVGQNPLITAAVALCLTCQSNFIINYRVWRNYNLFCFEHGNMTNRFCK